MAGAAGKKAVEVKDVRKKDVGPFDPPNQRVSEKAVKWYERNVVDHVIREVARAPRSSDVVEMKRRLNRVDKQIGQQTRYNQVLRSAALRLATKVASAQNGFKEAKLPMLRPKNE